MKVKITFVFRIQKKYRENIYHRKIYITYIFIHKKCTLWNILTLRAILAQHWKFAKTWRGLIIFKHFNTAAYALTRRLLYTLDNCSIGLYNVLPIWVGELYNFWYVRDFFSHWLVQNGYSFSPMMPNDKENTTNTSI